MNHSRHGGALLIAVLGAGLASLASLTAALLAARSLRTAAAWADAVRLDLAVRSAVHRTLAGWPPAFSLLPQTPGAAVVDSVGGVSISIRLEPVGDSVGTLIVTAELEYPDSSRSARREHARLLRLVPDPTDSLRVRGVSLGTTRDGYALPP